MKKVKELIQQVYRYEKQAEIETRYLSNVLYWSFFLLMFVNEANDCSQSLYNFPTGTQISSPGCSW